MQGQGRLIIMEEKSRRRPPREYGAETVRFECGCIQRRCERKHKGSVAPREERKNASRFRACSTTPLQSILRSKVGAKRWLVPPSRFPPTVSIFTSFVICKPIIQISNLSKKVSGRIEKIFSGKDRVIFYFRVSLVDSDNID